MSLFAHVTTCVHVYVRMCTDLFVMHSNTYVFYVNYEIVPLHARMCVRVRACAFVYVCFSKTVDDFY